MGSLDAYRRLFRIEHAFMLSFAVLLAMLVSSGGILPALAALLPALITPFLIEMGSFALNDYFDVKTDRENKRSDRPIASGEISERSALAAAALCYLLGIAAAWLLPPAAFYLALIFAALSIAYNWKLKDLPLVGNAYIAASMAVPFPFGGLVASGSLHPSLLAIASVAFVAGLGREIIKSAEDVEGDVKHRKAKTLPALAGKEISAKFAAALYLALVPLSFAPFASGLKMNTLAFGMVAITALSFAYLALIVLKDQKKENLEAARKASLLSLGIGLLGYAASLI
jgi:geranylgeranylglycerol-phosphate geranylgeranyltransferase